MLAQRLKTYSGLNCPFGESQKRKPNRMIRFGFLYSILIYY